jgi:D-glycero-alpha-D-manno-heptose 1-phosphate guanylyltransferase
MKAYILAGGFGTRLQSALDGQAIPKPMAPIAGKPFLAYLLDYLKAQGVTACYLGVHHHRDCIMDYFGNHYHDMPIFYIVEDEPLGTGGGIRLALEKIGGDTPILVLNGDSFITFDLKQFYDQHHGILSLLLTRLENTDRYGSVTIDAQQRILGFAEKMPGKAGFINAGVYLMSPALFKNYSSLPPAFSLETDFLMPNLADLSPATMVTSGYFIDIGIPEDYHRAQQELPAVVRTSCQKLSF